MQQKRLKHLMNAARLCQLLEEIGMGVEWTEDTKSAMMAAKQYLKMEYKVSYFKYSFSYYLEPIKEYMLLSNVLPNFNVLPN